MCFLRRKKRIICAAIIEHVNSKLNEDAKMIWGAQISEDMDKMIKVMVIITGVKSSQIVGGEGTKEEKIKKDMTEEIGIEFYE